MKDTITLGYTHYSREAEKNFFNKILSGDSLEDFTYYEGDNEPSAAPIPLRSVKNNLIILVSVICRAAADLGADDQLCYALSDHYLNEIEALIEQNDWISIMNGVLLHYRELVKRGIYGTYSLTVRRAMIFIHQRIYEKCSLKDVAAALKLHPNYLSNLFRTETGSTITDYIMREKIKEAETLIINERMMTSQVSDMLGFCNASYFVKMFRKEHHCTPGEFVCRAL